MQMLLKSAMKGAAPLIRSIACFISVAMLLSFPMIKPHNFSDHFRLPEVRRSIVRHTQVAQAEDATTESVERIGIQPNPLPLLLNVETKFATISNVELAPQASPTRLFLRLKLGASPAGGEDPFL
jgi:hypothetical protein